MKSKLRKILVIEDEPLLLKAFEYLLKSSGYDVEVAKNGMSGLEMTKSYKPDIVLLDMLMPIMNGMDYLEAANLAKTLPKSKVIILSNLSDSVHLRDVRKYNVSKILLKASLSPDELVTYIKNME